MKQKIELTEEEIAVIDKYFKGDIHMFGTNESDMEAMKSVISKAETLMIETDADTGDDLVLWYWDKYKNQEKEV